MTNKKNNNRNTRLEAMANKLSDKITVLTGSVIFIYIHIVWFGIWLIYNLTAQEPFDPFPFGLLTLIVSLEAIILATFILITQNRQSKISDIRAEKDYRVDIRSEKNSAEILVRLLEIQNLLKKNNK